MLKKVKKAVSMLVVSCLTVSVMNLPAFSYTTVNSTKNSQDYNLQQGYMTPAQAAKQANKNVKQTDSSTAVKQMAQQCKDIINKCLNSSVGSTTYVKNWMNQAQTLINNKLNSKEADSTKQAWLNKALTSLQAIEKEKPNDILIAISEQTIKSDGVFGTYQIKEMMSKNITYNIVETYGNKYDRAAVSLINNLAKETGMTKAEVHKELLALLPEDIGSTNGSTEVFRQKLQAGHFLPGTEYGPISLETKNRLEKIFIANNNTAVKKSAQECTNLINNLSKTYAANSYVKNWLNQAKTLINNKVNGKDSNYSKQVWLDNALQSLKAISNAKAKDVLTEVSAQTVSGVFATAEMKKTIQQNITYNIVANYGTTGVTLLNNLSKETGIAKADLYKLFKETKFTKATVEATKGSTAELKKQIQSGKYATTKLNNAINKLETATVEQCMNLIDKLTKTYSTNSYVKNWMNQVKKEINNKMNSDATKAQKQDYLNEAFASLKAIEKEKANDILIGLSEQTTKSDSVFNGYFTNAIMSKNITYNIVNAFGSQGRTAVTLINNLVKETGMSKAEVYNILLSLDPDDIGVTKGSTEIFRQKIQSGVFLPEKGHIALNVQETLKKAFIDNKTDTSNTSSTSVKPTTQQATQQTVKQASQQCTNLIDKLSKTYATNSYVKNWLNQAKKEINGLSGTTYTLAEKEKMLNNALKSLQTIEKAKASDILVAVCEQTIKADKSNGILCSKELVNTISKSLTFNVMNTVVGGGYSIADAKVVLTLISNLSKGTGLSQEKVMSVLSNVDSLSTKDLIETKGSVEAFKKKVETGDFVITRTQYWGSLQKDQEYLKREFSKLFK